MRLQSRIRVARPPAIVGRFLSDLDSLPRWDRGVAVARAISTTPPAVGFEFETLARPDVADASASGRMAYRITEIGPTHSTIELTSEDGNARYFKRAAWRFGVEPDAAGTLVTCSVEFVLRARYFFMTPLLFLMRRAITRDLVELKHAIEHG